MNELSIKSLPKDVMLVKCDGSGYTTRMKSTITDKVYICSGTKTIDENGVRWHVYYPE